MGSSRGSSQKLSQDKPSPARIYDYLLGGYHNFEVDRKAAQQFVEMLPDIPIYFKANRAFLRRAVSFLADQGIDQFLDLGSGIPTVGNVHEVAQKVNTSARVVYVDNDPVAVRHSKTILNGNPHSAAISGDIREPEAILDHPETRRLLDFTKPTAVLLLAVLLFVTDDEAAYRLVRVVRETLAPGSYIVISHPTEEGLPPENLEQGRRLYAASGAPVNIRSYAQIERFFEGFELLEPGVVKAPLWRPEGPEDLLLDKPESVGYYVGVGRKP